jgi:large subunit ribosomal protein L11
VRKVVKVVKLQLPAGESKPGPLLASAGINMAKFIKEFNDATLEQKGNKVPVIIKAYEDKSYEFEVKTIPAADLLKKAAGVSKGSANPQKTAVGSISLKQVREIAKYKLPDLNTNDLEAATKSILGTAKSLGLTVSGE